MMSSSCNNDLSDIESNGKSDGASTFGTRTPDSIESYTCDEFEVVSSHVSDLTTTRTWAIVRVFHRLSALIHFTQQRAKLLLGGQPSITVGELELEALKGEIDMDAHCIPLEELEERFSTDLTHGLFNDQVTALLARDGENILTPLKRESKFRRFSRHLYGGFATLLWISALLAITIWAVDSGATIDNLVLSGMLVFIIFLTGGFSYYQVAQSESILESFKDLVPSVATVLRGGHIIELPTKFLVYGDIVVVRAGQRVPADMRLFKCDQLKVDNSSLTGESLPQNRTIEPTTQNPLESKNLLFFGTTITEGNAHGVVINVGDNTVMGRISKLIKATPELKTPIAIELGHFINLITFVAIGVCLFSLSIAFIFESDKLDSLGFIVGMLVAQVPEGLLVTVTVALTLTARRLALKNCIVKNLEAVETLGSTSVICSDKTGTLTLNRMTVAHFWFDGNFFEERATFENVESHISRAYIADPISQSEGSQSYAPLNIDSKAFICMSTVMALCNRAIFKPDQNEMEPTQRECIGDPTDIALLKFVQRITDVETMRAKYSKLSELPFCSRNKYQSTVHFYGFFERNTSISKEKGKQPKNLETEQMNTTGNFIVTLKGAPERILDLCSYIYWSGNVVVLDDMHRKAYRMAYEKMGAQGERVLAFAQKFLGPPDFPTNYTFQVGNNGETNWPLNHMIFLGLTSLMDPPREGVLEAVETCRNAGIRVAMVTGDHPITAKAIARQVGIITKPTQDEITFEDGANQSLLNKSLVMNGFEMSNMDSEQLQVLLATYYEIIFARTSPQQKLVIVDAFQKQGYVVAVTGDGVNDSPALKQANIGVAMGSGSDVAKEAANMILLDDNFATIVVGIAEGRRLFDNLKKSIAYTLTSNVPELAPLVFSVILQIPLPLSAIVVIAIDTLSDIAPAISLAYEKPEGNVMLRNPRPRKDKLVNRRLISFSYGQIGVVQALEGFFSYGVIYGNHGWNFGDLIGIKEDWNSDNILSNSIGEKTTFEERKVIEERAQAAFFLTIVQTQWACLLVTKTRRDSLFVQGMNNKALTAAMLLETAVASLLIYTPAVQDIFRLQPLPAIIWLCALPFAFAIIIYDEIRKFWIRNHPGGWLDRETHY